jgi:hypothetical protein
MANYLYRGDLHPTELQQLTSRAVIFSDVGAAHAAFLEVSSKLERTGAGSQLAIGAIGQESLRGMS